MAKARDMLRCHRDTVHGDDGRQRAIPGRTALHQAPVVIREGLQHLWATCMPGVISRFQTKFPAQRLPGAARRAIPRTHTRRPPTPNRGSARETVERPTLSDRAIGLGPSTLRREIVRDLDVTHPNFPTRATQRDMPLKMCFWETVFFAYYTIFRKTIYTFFRTILFSGARRAGPYLRHVSFVCGSRAARGPARRARCEDP